MNLPKLCIAGITLIAAAATTQAQTPSPEAKEVQQSLVDMQEQLAQARAFVEALDRNPTDMESFRKAEESYNRILQENPQHLIANLDLGLLYYNYAVTTINSGDKNATGSEVGMLMVESQKYFSSSLPYMLKAYHQQPKNETVLTALSGIYFALHNLEASERFKKELEEL